MVEIGSGLFLALASDGLGFALLLLLFDLVGVSLGQRLGALDGTTVQEAALLGVTLQFVVDGSDEAVAFPTHSADLEAIEIGQSYTLKKKKNQLVLNLKKLS